MPTLEEQMAILEQGGDIPMRLEKSLSLEDQFNILNGKQTVDQTVGQTVAPPVPQSFDDITLNQDQIFDRASPEDIMRHGSALLENQNLIGEINPKIDLGSGIDEAIGLGSALPLRAGLSFDDTTSEENRRLTEKFGEIGSGVDDGGFFRDAKGTVFVNPQGLVHGGYEDQRPENIRNMSLRLDELGGSWGDVADLSSEAIDIGVPLVTSLASGGSGVPAAFYRAYNVMRASAATKTIEESTEQFLGSNQQDAGEVVRNVGMFTLMSGITELGGSAVASIMRRALVSPKARRLKLDPRTVEEILSDVQKGKFDFAWSKLPENVWGEIVKGVSRGVQRGKNPITKAYHGTTGAFKGGLKGIDKSVDNTKLNFGKVGEDKQVASPIQQRLTDEVRKFGGRPKIDRATKSPVLGKLHSLSEYIVGKHQRTASNVKALAKKKALLEKQAGGGERIVNSKLTMGKAKLKAQKAVRQDERASFRSEQNIKEDFSRADNAIKNAIENAVHKLKTTVGKAGNAGANFKKGIELAKNTFSLRSGQLADKIDRLAGGKPIIAMKNTKQAISDVLSRGIKGKDGKTIQIGGDGKVWLNQILNKGEGRQTFKSMTEFLSEMTSAGHNPNLVGDVTQVHANAIKEAILKDMNSAVLGYGPKAVREWNVFRQWYKHKIKQFDDVAVADLSREVRSGGVDASKIVSKIGNVKSAEQIIRIKRVLKDKGTWEQIKREFMGLELGKAVDVHGNFNPSRFYQNMQALDGMGKKGSGRVFSAIFDKDAKDIMYLARELDQANVVFKGTGLPFKESKKAVSELEPSEFKDAMKAMLVEVAKKRSKFLGKNGTKEVIEAIAKTDDDISAYLMQTGTESGKLARQVKEAREFYGVNSKEWKAIQFDSAKVILNKFMKKGDDPLEAMISGTQLKKTIEGAKKQIIEMFDEKTYNSWDEFADVTSHVSTLVEQKSNAGVIAVSQISLHPLQNLGRIGQFNVLARLFLSKDGLDYFTKGLKKGIGGQFARKVGITGLKGSAYATSSETQKLITKIVTENREDFKEDFPKTLSIPKIKELLQRRALEKE